MTTLVRICIWLLALTPFVYGSYVFFWTIGLVPESFTGIIGEKVADPVKFILDLAAITAVQFLMASLFVTPLRKYLKFNLVKYRRLLGLWAFTYALIHVSLFLMQLFLDTGFDPASIYEELIKKPFIFIGLIAFLILLFIALTSLKKLYAKFVKWHKLVYVAIVLVSIHFMMSQKILSTTEGIYVLVFIALLLVRMQILLALIIAMALHYKVVMVNEWWHLIIYSVIFIAVAGVVWWRKSKA
jgi:methionine sulfoxide reductase heme-binding subunit